ncbi:MAG: hypothetical protein H0Z33_05500 [Bacillaceae bacterium]|nr:hypothetical protein [Bacillaceae bacterium]
MNMDSDDLLFLERISDYVMAKHPESSGKVSKRARSKQELEKKVEYLSQMIQETDYCVQLAKMRLEQLKKNKLAVHKSS